MPDSSINKVKFHNRFSRVWFIGIFAFHLEFIVFKLAVPSDIVLDFICKPKSFPTMTMEILVSGTSLFTRS